MNLPMMTTTLLIAAASVGAQAQPAPPALSPGWSRALPPGPDARVKITEEYARHVARDAFFWAWPLVNIYNKRLALDNERARLCRPGAGGAAQPDRHAHRLRGPRRAYRRLPQPGRGLRRRRARRSTYRRSWSRCPTSATASGSIRRSTCAPTASSSSARCTARRRASTCWSGRTGTARCPKGITRCSAPRPTPASSRRASSWTTRRRIERAIQPRAAARS